MCFDISVYFLTLFFPLGTAFLLFEFFKSNLKPTLRSTSSSTSAVRGSPVSPGANFSSNSYISLLGLSSNYCFLVSIICVSVFSPQIDCISLRAGAQLHELKGEATAVAPNTLNYHFKQRFIE